MSSKLYIRFASAAALTLFMSVTTPSAARAQWSIEGRVGSSIPGAELTDNPGLNQTGGLSLAADVMYTFQPRWSLYAGASREGFHCDACSEDVTSLGIDGGLKYVLGSSGAALPWVRGGLMLHRAAVDGLEQDWGFGVDAGLGVDWVINPRLWVVPALRINAYDSGPISLTYVTIDLGLHIHPGS